MADPADDIAARRARLAAGRPDIDERRRYRIPKPIYQLSVDEPDDLSIRTSRDGVTRATIALPKWHELPEGGAGLTKCTSPCPSPTTTP